MDLALEECLAMQEENRIECCDWQVLREEVLRHSRLLPGLVNMVMEYHSPCTSRLLRVVARMYVEGCLSESDNLRFWTRLKEYHLAVLQYSFDVVLRR